MFSTLRFLSFSNAGFHSLWDFVVVVFVVNLSVLEVCWTSLYSIIPFYVKFIQYVYLQTIALVCYIER